MHRRIFGITGWAGIALVAMLGGYIGMNIADRSLPVVLVESGMDTPIQPIGGVVRARYKFIRSKSCSAHVERMIFDAMGQRFVVPDLDFANDILPLGEDVSYVPFTIPLAAVPGKAVYRTVNCYECNWTHKFAPVCAAPREIQMTLVPP